MWMGLGLMMKIRVAGMHYPMMVDVLPAIEINTRSQVPLELVFP
jgi:hypothetical protein